MANAEEQKSSDGLHDAVCRLGSLANRDSGAADERGQPTLRTSEYGDSRPHAVMPPTVLVTELDSGELVIQGRPDGPRAYLSAAGAMPLKRELVAAFATAELIHHRNHDGQDDER